MRLNSSPIVPFLITFSGPDCSGKSTQIQYLSNYLASKNIRFTVIWFRLGYTPGFTLLKNLLRKPRFTALPAPGHSSTRSKLFSTRSIRFIWLFLSLIDLFFTTVFLTRFYHWRSISVISDRWLYDSLIDRAVYYQSDTWADFIINKFIIPFASKPFLSVVLQISLDQALLRSTSKKEPFPDPLTIRAMRHHQYSLLARNPHILSLPSTDNPSKVFNAIKSRIA